MTENITLRVDAGGQRVDKFLAEHSLLSRSAIQRLARDGHVRVDGAAVEPAYKVRAGQELVATNRHIPGQPWASVGPGRMMSMSS